MCPVFKSYDRVVDDLGIVFAATGSDQAEGLVKELAGTFSVSTIHMSI